MKLYLIRHGETGWNRVQRLQGLRDVPLNGRGVRQARRLADQFRDVPIAAVFSSPLARARQTASLISGRGQWPVVIEDDLREIDHGSCTGMRVRAVARKFPDGHAGWRWSPDRFAPVTGESLQEVYRRAIRVFLRILSMGLRGDVAVVSHGVINALLLCAAEDLPIARVWEFSQLNGGANVLRLQGCRVVSVEEVGDERN